MSDCDCDEHRREHYESRVVIITEIYQKLIYRKLTLTLYHNYY